MSRILLADNNSLALNMGRQILAEEGHEVATVSDGGEVLRVLEEQPPEIVIVETGLPGTSGVDICRRIKSNPNLDHIKVLLLAGHRETLDDAELSEARPDGVLRKPLDPGTVARTVQELSVGGAAVDARSGAGAKEPAGKQEAKEGSENDVSDATEAPQAGLITSASEGDPFAAVVERALRKQAAGNPDREQIRKAVADVMEFALPALIDRVTDRVLELLRKDTSH